MGGMISAVQQPWTNWQQYMIQERLMDKTYDQQMDAWREQQAYLQEMFPFVSEISQNATDLYGGNWDKIEDYLLNPTPPSNLERQLFEFFGGTQLQPKGYYKGQKYPGVRADKRTQRLLRRYGGGTPGPLAGMGQDYLDTAMGLMESLIPYGQDWAETGFKTDIGPIQDYALRMFEREMMPEVAERFGSNIFGSGYQQRMGDTMADVASELGAMEVMLNEAAAARRAQGLGGDIQNIFTGPMNLATAYATAAAQAGQNYMDRVNAARPGAGLLAALPMFGNIAASQGFIQQGFPTSGTDYGNIMSAWGANAGQGASTGQDISDIMDIISLFGGGTDGGAGAGTSMFGGAGDYGSDFISYGGNDVSNVAGAQPIWSSGSLYA